MQFTSNQLYSTASYNEKNLTGINLSYNELVDWNLSEQTLVRSNISSANLSDARLRRANLKDANLSGARLVGVDMTDAKIEGANLESTTSLGLTSGQLYSTASFKNGDLRGIDLSGNDLTGWDLSGQNLSGARFTYASLRDTTLSHANLADTWFVSPRAFGSGADVRGADMSFCDLRGALLFDVFGANTRNSIGVNGSLDGLDIETDEGLIIRDDNPIPLFAGAEVRMPIPIVVNKNMNVHTGGSLHLLFESDLWDSLISFETGIPIQLGGTLELTFTDDTQLATQSGRTIKAFDWSGVNPQGTFTVQGQPGTAWDTSKLYSTGEVTLLGISSDLNADKDVDSEDLLDFLANWTGSEYPVADKTWQMGDSDEDGDVDSADMLVFLNQWTGEAAEAPRLASVPEPSGVWLLGLALVGITKDLRRRERGR